jgi:hypothetical protein
MWQREMRLLMVVFKFTLGRWRFTFSMAPITEVVGVNSILPDGNHILMWDFDDTNPEDVLAALFAVKIKYELPDIYVLETRKGKNYIAYCFKRTSWRRAVEIIASTPGVDWNFFKYGVYRGRFTLRVGDKGHGRPKLYTVIHGWTKSDVKLEELKSWVKYETLEDDKWNKKIEFKVGG